MGNGKKDHFDANAVINQSVGNLVGLPGADGTNDTVCLQIKNDNALPPREKHHALDTEKLAEGSPVDGITQLVVDGVKEFDQTIESVHDRYVHEKGNVRVCLVPFELTLPVQTQSLQNKGQDRQDHPDHHVLQNTVFALEHEFHSELPGFDKEVDGEAVLSEVRVVFAPEDLHESVLPSQEFNEVIEETGNDVGFVNVPDRVNVESGVAVPETEPGLDRIEGDHPQDPHHVFLNVGHVPVGEVQVNEAEGQDKGSQDHDFGRTKGRHVGASVRSGLVNDHGNQHRHGGKRNVPQQITNPSKLCLARIP